MVNSLLLQGGLEKQSDEDSREYLAVLVAIGHCTRTSLAMDFQHLHLAWMQPTILACASGITRLGGTQNHITAPLTPQREVIQGGMKQLSVIHVARL
jgi:hypothetical protein